MLYGFIRNLRQALRIIYGKIVKRIVYYKIALKMKSEVARNILIWWEE